MNVRNYEQYKNIGTGYKNAKNKESFFEAHESQFMILEAAEREIRSKWMDPENVSYEQVKEGIEKLTQRKKEVQSEYRTVSGNLQDMEKQMKMMRKYLGKDERRRTVSRHDHQAR